MCLDDLIWRHLLMCASCQSDTGETDHEPDDDRSLVRTQLTHLSRDHSIAIRDRTLYPIRSVKKQIAIFRYLLFYLIDFVILPRLRPFDTLFERRRDT